MAGKDIAHVTFTAAFPAIQCIKLQGDGGARIVLDIPETDVAAVDTLRHWRNMVLMVTVVPVKSDGGPDTRKSRNIHI